MTHWSFSPLSFLNFLPHSKLSLSLWIAVLELRLWAKCDSKWSHVCSPLCKQPEESRAALIICILFCWFSQLPDTISEGCHREYLTPTCAPCMIQQLDLWRVKECVIKAIVIYVLLSWAPVEKVIIQSIFPIFLAMAAIHINVSSYFCYCNKTAQFYTDSHWPGGKVDLFT